MNQLTNTQQTDLNLWLKDTSQELPTSLENFLMEDCRNNVNDKMEGILYTKTVVYQAFTDSVFLTPESELSKKDSCEDYRHTDLGATLLFLAFLSRTPDGAVMPFLDVENKNKLYVEGRPDDLLTLDHLLYREFTEALRIGKTLDEALKIINKIYILERYV